jgi:hypothetical protein
MARLARLPVAAIPVIAFTTGRAVCPLFETNHLSARINNRVCRLAHGARYQRVQKLEASLLSDNGV